MGVPLDVQLFKTTLTLEEANGIQQWNITLSHGFPKRPYIRMQCDRHNVFNFHLNCPCPCFRFIFSLMKKKKGLPPQGGSPFSIDDLMPDSPTLTEKAFSGLIPEWMAVDQSKSNTIQKKIMFSMPSTNRFFSSLDSYSVNNNGTAIASFPVGNPPKQKLKMVNDKNRFSSIGENLSLIHI